MSVSSASLPLAANSLKRRMTRMGDGKNSGSTHPSAVTTVHATARLANTTAAMPMNSAVEIGAPKARRRRGLGRGRTFPSAAFASGGGGIHESAVDQRGEVDVLGEDAGLEGGGLHLRHHLVDEIA